MTLGDLFAMMEGAGLRRWYVAEDILAVDVLSGPFRTLKLARREVARIAREREQPGPWPWVERFPGYPGFYALHTDTAIYYAGRAAAFCDQGDKWCDAIVAYEEKLGIGC